MSAYHRQHHLRGNAEHAGVALGINVGIAGSHAAQIILANLDADPQLKLNVLSITNRTLMITAHGQMTDIMNELVDHPAPADVERVMEWKTALYSVTNPIHVGMVLAGAGCEDTDAITPFGLHVGKAFQIADDLLGIFGNEQEIGKSPMDDIREGKITLLTQYALEHATAADRAELRRCLGKSDVTKKEFVRCQQIITASGAADHARKRADDEVTQALAALDAVASRWPEADVAFLRGLAHKMATRTA
jgi:geranylgeranyl pyrophosphate synthase